MGSALTYCYKPGKEAIALNRYAGGNNLYRKAREWWLEHPRCSEKELRKYLIHDFGFIADSGDDEERAHKIAVCLCQSTSRQTSSIGSVSLLVALCALVVSICSGQLSKLPQLVGWVLLTVIGFIVLFSAIWVVLKIKTDRRLTRDTEFRGRLLAL